MIPDSNLDLLVEAGYAPAAEYDLTTPYGRRRFDVWQHCDEDKVVVVKDMGTTPLIVTCALGATAASIEGTFLLLSGRPFAQRRWTMRAPENLLHVGQLEDAAREEALNQELLESQFQEMQLLLADCSFPFPSALQVWSGGVLTPRALEAQLKRLRELTESELVAWAGARGDALFLEPGPEDLQSDSDARKRMDLDSSCEI